MAEAIAIMYADERRWNIEVKSAGTRAIAGQEAAANSVKAIREIGGDLTEHRSQPMTQELVDWADRILVMEMRHASDVRNEFERADEKIQLLGTFGGMVEIDDPYGSWIFRFRRSRGDIKRCVEAFMDRLPPNPR